MLSSKKQKIDLKKTSCILLTQSNQEHIQNELTSIKTVLSS